MAIKKEILYPVFLECLQFINDAFWENIFEDLAYGKTPYGTYINKDFLCCNYKNKEFSYKIEKKDPKTLYNDIYSLLGNKHKGIRKFGRRSDRAYRGSAGSICLGPTIGPAFCDSRPRSLANLPATLRLVQWPELRPRGPLPRPSYHAGTVLKNHNGLGRSRPPYNPRTKPQNAYRSMGHSRWVRAPLWNASNQQSN